MEVLDPDGAVSDGGRGDLKSVVLAVLVPTIAWQIYLVTLLLRAVPAMRQFASDLGMELSVFTRLLIDLYPASAAVPVITAVLAVDVLRRPVVTRRHAVVVVIIAVTFGFALHAWATEAAFRPMVEMMRAVG